MRCVGIVWLALAIFSTPAFADSHSNPARSVLVLIYHEIVTENRDPGLTVISLEKFKQQMQYLSDQGYTTLSMRELILFMKGNLIVPDKSIVLNFDDGWRNVLRAVPYLKKYGFKASFWVITGDGFGDSYLEWPDVEALDKDPDFEVESHTVTHPWDPQSNLLTWLEGRPSDKGMADVRREIFESKATLEKYLQRKVRYLAWPCGWYNEILVAIAKEAGYEALLTTKEEPNRPGDDIFHIKRIFVNGRCDQADFERMLGEGKTMICSASGQEH